MNVAKLRELSAAINPPDRLAVLIESSPVSPEPVTTETAADALTWAANEIERLTQADADSTATLDAAAEKIGSLALDVERLKMLALDGWKTAQTLAVAGGHASSERRAIAIIREIEAAS